MPWLSEAKKDVTSCEKLWREANTHRPADIRMGEPTGSDSGICIKQRRTQGTETSQYLQEKKVITIPQVEAIERGRAQTAGVEMRAAG